MKSIQTEIFNRAVRNQVDLERYSEHLREKVVALLDRAQVEILKSLVENDPTIKPATEWKKKRLQRLNEQIGEILKDHYGKIEKGVNDAMLNLAEFSQENVINGMKDILKVNLFDIVLTQENLREIVSSTMIEGATIGAWWKERPEIYRQRFEKEINRAMGRIEIGMVKGEAIGELVRAVRGTQTTPGILNVSKHEAAALVRTSVMQVASNVRQGIYEANQDVLNGYQVVATLDTRTTSLCRALDGHTYGLDRKPLDGGPPLPPGPPFHWNCRSCLICLVKSYSELAGGKDEFSNTKRKAIDDIDKDTRASMNGQVPASLDYGSWLKTQPVSVQKDVLGPARFDLWTSGKLSMVDMVHQNGRPLTLEELKRKISNG